MPFLSGPALPAVALSLSTLYRDDFLQPWMPEFLYFPGELQFMLLSQAMPHLQCCHSLTH